MGRGFRRESGVGKGPVEGEGARFVPAGCLDRLVRTVPKLVVMLPRKKIRTPEKWGREVRGAGRPWGFVLPPALVPWSEVWRPIAQEELGLLPT